MDAKPFFVVVTFVLLIALFAGGAMSSKDLTPNTPPAGDTGGGVMNAYNFPYTAGDPINSPCGTTYTVRSGDTLFRIAAACNVTLADLRAANHSIAYSDLIYPGQKLYIYYPLPIVPTVASPTAAPTAVLPAAQDNDIPVTGLVPGGSIHVSANHLPGNTQVEIAIGKVGEPPAKVSERSTDEHGSISLKVKIPESAKPGEQWAVTITTTTVPPIKISSSPFVIR